MRVRRTRQRQVVLEVVRSTMDHPSADWVFRQARRRLPGISLATVYRNLKELAVEGLIREVHAGGPTARFDSNTGRHYHIRCVGCGRVNDLPLSVDDGLEREAGRATNYAILGHAVEVHGLCPGCKQNKKDSQLGGIHGWAQGVQDPRQREARHRRGEPGPIREKHGHKD